MRYLYLFCLLLTACSSDISFPEPVRESKVILEIGPDTVVRTVVISQIEPIDTIVLPIGKLSDTRMLPFGRYEIQTTAHNFGTNNSTLEVKYETHSFEKELLPYPKELDHIHPSSGDTISRKNYVQLTFNTHFDSLALYELISFNPPIDYSIIELNNSGNGYSLNQDVKLELMPYDLYKNSTLNLLLSDTIHSITGSSLEFPYSATYTVDTSIDSSQVYNYYIKEVEPHFNNYFAEPLPFEIIITLKSSVIASSVEKAFTITPPLPGKIYTHNEKFSYQLGDVLPTNTDITITLDTSLYFTDSSKIEEPLTLSIKTPPLQFLWFDSYPRKYSKTVLADSSFVLIFNTTIDTNSFAQAFSLTPPCDSMHFEYSPARDTVWVRHSTLLSQTEYTLAMDTTIVDIYGNTVAPISDITFTVE